MTVRNCDYDDLEFLVDKAMEFNRAYYDVPLNPDKLVDYLVHLLDSPYGVVLRTEHGGITGIIVQDPLRDWWALVETAWFSTGKDGLALLPAFEERGYEEGVDEIRMSTLWTNPVVDKLLERKGYQKVEASYRKLVGQ